MAYELLSQNKKVYKGEGILIRTGALENFLKKKWQRMLIREPTVCY